MRNTHEDVRAIRNLLSAHDPAADHPGDHEAMERARIEVIASASQPRRTPPLLSWGTLTRPAVMGTAAAVAAAALLAPFVLRDSAPAHATPPPAPLNVPMTELTDAEEHLRDLADAAEAAEAPERNGDVAYVRTSEWIFTYAQNADNGQTGWGILPEERRVWRAPDESGVEVIVTGEAEYRGGDRGPLDFLSGGGSEKFTWGDGEGGDGMFFTWEPHALSTDPEELEEQLVQGASHETGARVTTLFLGLQSLYTEAPVSPQVQAAALRALAEHDGVLYAGEHRDRQGREGELFVIEDSETQEGGRLEHRILFDSETGAPLYFEVVTVESEEEIEGVELPMVNQYVVISETAWVAEVEEQP